uniref:Saccharopine dehydrogenase-like oxidoreductase n=1 Tax=Cacopsylla melanoneura TaxID=428564 RepID=A0A8D8ZHE4_9HEMI
MTNRLNILIFGATGFTGKYAVIEMVKLSKEFDMTWGVAGRSMDKLKSLLEWATEKTGEHSVKEIPIIIADVKDEAALSAMAAKTQVLVNCCGPYRHFGAPVVKACVENKTHYVDVSGEPYFMEKMQLDNNQQAKDKGVYVVSACGLDSIPADLGIVHMKHIFNGQLNSVEAYLSTKAHKPRGKNEASIHYATWESAVYGLGFAADLTPLRQSLYSEKLPRFSPPLKARSVLHKNMDGQWCLPFPGADRSVVYRTQRHSYITNKERPVAMHAYIACDGLYAALVVMLTGAVFSLLAKFKFGRNLLLRYPRFFSGGFISHEGPSEDYMNQTEFFMKFIGQGWTQKLPTVDQEYTTAPDKTVVAQISAFNPGYGFTVTALLLSAITLLREPSTLPPCGGVYTPGAAFEHTSLFNQLTKHGMKFEVLSDSSLGSKSKL